jgi:hypothetical protein
MKMNKMKVTRRPLRSARTLIREIEIEKNLIEGEIVPQVTNFSMLAFQAFESTYRQLYAQALEETARLERNNRILKTIENELTSEEVLHDMEPVEKIKLATMLQESNQGSLKLLMEFSRIFRDIRTQVGFYEGLAKTDVGKVFESLEATPTHVAKQRGLEALELLRGLDADDDEED